MRVEIIIPCEGKSWRLHKEHDLLLDPYPGLKIYVSDQSHEVFVETVAECLLGDGIEVVCRAIDVDTFTFVAWNGDFRKDPWKFQTDSSQDEEGFRQAMAEYNAPFAPGIE